MDRAGRDLEKLHMWHVRSFAKELQGIDSTDWFNSALNFFNPSKNHYLNQMQFDELEKG